MKKKGPKSIPDFSTKRTPTGKAPAPDRKSEAQPSVRSQKVKPQGTSAKSGRRGQ